MQLGRTKENRISDQFHRYKIEKKRDECQRRIEEMKGQVQYFVKCPICLNTPEDPNYIIAL